MILLFEEKSEHLGECAFDLSRLGFEIGYASAISEARLMVADPDSAYEILVFPPTLTDAELASVIGGCRSTPHLITVGDDPGSKRRQELRELGAFWGIWSPPFAQQLAFTLSIATDLHSIVPPASRFAAVRLDAWIKAPETAASAYGRVRLLSEKGLLIETKASPAKEDPATLEFWSAELSAPIRGHVTQTRTDLDSPQRHWKSCLCLRVDPNDESSLRTLKTALEAALTKQKSDQL